MCDGNDGRRSMEVRRIKEYILKTLMDTALHLLETAG